MSRIRIPVLLLGTSLLAGPAMGQQAISSPIDSEPLEARVWLDRGDEPVLSNGDQVRVYYRTTQDAEAAIFRIDTDGRVSLVFPARPGADPTVGAGRDFRLLMGAGGEWKVREDPGVGHYFMVASRDGLDFRAFEGPTSSREWDLSRVGEAIYEDPYLAIDDYVAALLPDWEVAPYALDFIEYSVGEDHEYPRYLCYDCHDYQPYAAWDPYSYACTTYRVVLYDDPYFYPEFRYVGSRAVFASPLQSRPRYAVAVRATGEGWSPLVRRRSAPALPRGAAQYKEIQAANALDRIARTRRAAPVASGGRPTAKSPSTASAPRSSGVRTSGSWTGSVAAPRRGPSGPVRPSSVPGDAAPRTTRVTGSVASGGSGVARRVPATGGSKSGRAVGSRTASPTQGSARSGSVARGTTSRGSASRRTGAVTSQPAPTRSVPRATNRPTSRVTPASGVRRAPSASTRAPRSTTRSTPRAGSTRVAPTRTGTVRPTPSRSGGSRASTSSRTPPRRTPAVRPTRSGGTGAAARPATRRPSGTRPVPVRRKPGG